jgi:hypothetical protein
MLESEDAAVEIFADVWKRREEGEESERNLLLFA